VCSRQHSVVTRTEDMVSVATAEGTGTSWVARPRARERPRAGRYCEGVGTQVTIVGGGSYQWAPELMADLFGTPALAGMHLVLEDIDPAPLPKMKALAHKVNEALGAGATVATTTDLGTALDGADFVIVCISTGGFHSMAVDLDVPAVHGITQTVGDTVGPGGINRALRNVPVLVGIGKAMEQHCPDAWLFNITNPMTCLTRAVCRETRIKTVGLCHEVGNFCMDLAIAMGRPFEAVSCAVTGVNHFPVLTSLEVDPDSRLRPHEVPFLEGERGEVTILFGGLTWKHERLIEVEWDRDGTTVFVASIEVLAFDRSRLLADVSRVVSEHHLNIVAARTATTPDRVSRMAFDVELADPTHLHSLISALKHLDGVFDAYRQLPGKKL